MTLEELLLDPPHAAALVTAREISRLLLDIAARQAELAARATTLAAAQSALLAAQGQEASMRPARGPARLLSVNEAAGRLGVRPRYITDNWRSLPFVTRLSPRRFRVDEDRLNAYIRTRASA